MTRRFFPVLALIAAVALAQDVNGKWNFVWQTPGGERRSTLSITVENGKASVLFPDAKSPLTGTFQDGKLAVTGKLYSAEAGEEGQFHLNGTWNAGELKGSASWQEHEMTFSARRAQ